MRIKLDQNAPLRQAMSKAGYIRQHAKTTDHEGVLLLVMESGLRGSQWSGTASDNETSPNPLPPLTETHHMSPHLPHKMVADQENFHDLGDQCSETEEKIHLGDKYLFPYTGKSILSIYLFS
jgi:hypothetical protein